MVKSLKRLCILALSLSACTAGIRAGEQESTSAPRIVNVINFIRQTEPRIDAITDEVLYRTVVEQVKLLNRYGIKGTYLLQYDALISPSYQELLKKETLPGTEIGGWWEITQPHVEAAGLKWRGRYPWDWHADVGFATGYTPEEREKLVDVYMAKFKEIFGKYPSAIGSWFIDAHTLAYMYDKYHIEASCNCRDQIGTDGYTLWGGYWQGGYYPSRKNAYMPAQTRKGQIPVPVFRMLGSDPIYQYDLGIGGNYQGVVTLEPVYGSAGGSETWVKWFFDSMFKDPGMGLSYVQAGQENSFTWGAMKKGLETGQALQALPLRWLGLRPDADNSEAEIPMYYGTTSEGVNGYIRTSRKLALDYLKQHQSPSYAQMTLPLMPQFRMTRRLVGKEQLEVVPDRYVESSIGCMIHSLEIPAEVYEFPYGGLIDTEITNIAAAGRIVSATGRGWEVARFIPACVLTGEAAGLAVSMAAKENISLQALDVPALQHTLASRGVKIHMDEALRRNRRPQPGEKKDPKKTDATSVVRADSLSYRH